LLKGKTSTLWLKRAPPITSRPNKGHAAARGRDAAFKKLGNIVPAYKSLLKGKTSAQRLKRAPSSTSWPSRGQAVSKGREAASKKLGFIVPLPSS